MISKRGNMVTENAVGLILAVAASFVLILLMVALFNPTFDKGEEVAESYFGSLEDAISEADKQGASSFFMLDMGDEALEFYLVYFGEVQSFGEDNKERQKALLFMEDNKEFVRSPKDGQLCICYWQGDRTLCDDCISLDGVVNYAEKGAAPWVAREGEYININKRGNDYVFVRG
jgi:hypothetical protein